MQNKVGKLNEFHRVEWLKNTLNKIPEHSRILDAGAGEQRFKPFCTHLNYISQDFGKYDGIGDNAGKQTGSWDQTGLDIVCDITNIPEPDGSFDAVMCIEVFEHLPNPIAAIKEFTRLLKTDGFLILTAPRCSLTHMAPYHFYSGFNKFFYITHLEQNGIDIIELISNGNFFEYVAQEIRHIKNRAKKYAVDRPNLLEKLSLKVVLNMLNRFSQKDHSSDELICFGYHILARKK